jgi:hypothetical protein
VTHEHNLGGGVQHGGEAVLGEVVGQHGQEGQQQRLPGQARVAHAVLEQRAQFLDHRLGRCGQ